MSLCFLLTAGQGSRLKPYTDKVAKPGLPFLNLPLCFYGFFLAHHGGFKNFLLNKHHLPNQIEGLAQSLSPFATSVATVDESQKLLGSGGALWNARKTLSQQDYFLVANGDEILFPQSSDVLAHLTQRFIQDQALCTLLTCDHPDLGKTLKPVWVDPKGEVKGFGLEQPAANLRPVHYTGYKVFSKRILNHLPEGESNIFYDVLAQQISKGEKVSTFHLGQVSWHETGDFASFLQASRQVALDHAEGLAQRRNFFSRPPLSYEKSGENLLVFVDNERHRDSVFFEGTVVLGQSCKFSQPTKLQNVVVMDLVHLEKSGTVLNQMLMPDTP